MKNSKAIKTEFVGDTMKKYKCEVECIAVKLKPHYADREYTVIEYAKREIKKARIINQSYNKHATVYIYEREGQDWKLKSKIDIPEFPDQNIS